MSNAFTAFDPSTISSFETDPLSIHLNGDNDSSISANILFPLGITIPDYVANEKLVFGSTSPTVSFSFYDYFGIAKILALSPDTATTGQAPVAFDWRAGNSNQTGVNAGSGQFVGGSVISPGTGSGGDFLFGGGSGRGAGSSGGRVRFQGGTGAASATYGYISLDFAGSPNNLPLTGISAITSMYIESNLEVDGTTWLDGNALVGGTLNVTGATTLASSLTGILKGTSGLVAVASASDILSAIGTIDISSNTNLAVTAPITLTGDTLGFDQTANFTWTGTHNFQADIHINDGVTVSFDGAGKSLYLIGNSGELEGYADGLLNIMMGIGYFQVHSELYSGNNFYWNNSGGAFLATFGGGLSSAIVAPNATSDAVSIAKQTTTSTTTRGLLVQAEWAGTSAGSSQPVNGFNSFVYTATSATQPLTSASAQGALRNRMVARHRATNAAATITRMAGLSAGAILDAGVGAVTDAASFIAEAESVGLATTLTNNYGLLTLSNAITGTITNNYGIYITELLAGTNRYEQFFEGGGGSFYRAAAQQIYSSASNTLDFDAGTTQNLRINGTTEMSITGTLVDIATNDLAIASGSKIHMEGPSGDTYHYYDSGSSSWKFYVNGTLAMELK